MTAVYQLQSCLKSKPAISEGLCCIFINAKNLKGKKRVVIFSSIPFIKASKPNAIFCSCPFNIFPFQIRSSCPGDQGNWHPRMCVLMKEGLLISLFSDFHFIGQLLSFNG